MTTFLLTGANRGIGLAMAAALIGRGDRVIAAVRDPFKLPDLLKTAAREHCIVIGMDVADQRSVDRAAASIKEPVDVLVNNAGFNPPGRSNAITADLAAFTRTLEVNTIAPLRVAQAFLPQLRQSKNGRMLTVSSQMGALTTANSSGAMAYRASKTAVNKVMQCLASDLRSENIPVVVAHPGWVRTDMGGGGADLSPEDSAAGLITLIDGLTMKDTGLFFRWNGTIHPW
jgi:NAD(P)-dependent dehydrogenase (short-subunit alcohol dehydrogenase family)